MPLVWAMWLRRLGEKIHATHTPPAEKHRAPKRKSEIVGGVSSLISSGKKAYAIYATAQTKQKINGGYKICFLPKRKFQTARPTRPQIATISMLRIGCHFPKRT